MSRLTKRTGSSSPRIESGANTTASRSVIDRDLEVLERLLRGVCAVIPAHASTGSPLVGAEARVGLGDLFRTDADHLLADAIVDAIPLAGGPGGEHHVGARALLHDETDESALITLEE